MPLYEYYCENCNEVFEALRPVSASEEPAQCPKCGADAERIMPTTFASMSRKEGWAQRVPYHHHPGAGRRAGEDDRSGQTEGVRQA